MAKFSDWIDLAERLYVEKGLSPKQICAELSETPGLGASEPPALTTLYDWVKKYGWRKKREVWRKGPQGAMASMEEVMPALAQRLRELVRKPDFGPADIQEMSRIADSLAKITRSIRSVRRGTDTKEAMLIIMRPFVKWILEHEKPGELRDRMSEHIHNFSNHMVSER